MRSAEDLSSADRRRRRIDWHHIAARHELSGSGILNVTHFCAVDVLARQLLLLDLKGLEAAIQREYLKEGRIV
jgi:hypothetical protein